MRMHRYTQIIVPLNKFYQQLTPKGRMALNVLEAGLVVLLFVSTLMYL